MAAVLEEQDLGNYTGWQIKIFYFCNLYPWLPTQGESVTDVICTALKVETSVLKKITWHSDEILVDGRKYFTHWVSAEC